MERRAIERNRRAASATGWRRWARGGTWWAPAGLALAQVFGLLSDHDAGWPLVTLRLVALALAILAIVVYVIDRRKPAP
jgi:undecaprenyl pyrophosphate phosphatase UppP